MERLFKSAGALSAFLAVGAGAFGAHYLRQRLSPEYLSTFETAARYQMYHALALWMVGWAAASRVGDSAQAAGWCFIAGTLLFCGSLYILALTEIRWFGAITPLGGIAFLAGWLLLAWQVIRH